MGLKERIENMSLEEKHHILKNIESVVSDILSDKYDAKITITLRLPEEESEE